MTMDNAWLAAMEALYGKEYVDRLVKNTYGKRMSDPIFKFANDTYAVFGVLKEVWKEGPYIHIKNEKGQITSMSTKYYSHVAKQVRANKLIGHAVVTRTGPGWSPLEYFSSVYPLTSVDIRSIAEDAGPQAQEQIIKTKIAFYETKQWLEKQLEQSMSEMEAETERHRREMEQLTPQEKSELLNAQEELDRDWPLFVEHPNRALGIIGAAYHGGKLSHLDKYFAMRMGIDSTKRKRIQVKITDRGKKNYVRGTLPEYHDLPVVAALKKSRQADTKGQWVIASIQPGDLTEEYFTQELAQFPQGVKDMIEPLDFWMKQHHIIWDKVGEATGLNSI